MEPARELAPQQSVFDGFRQRTAIALGVFAASFTTGLAQRVAEATAANDTPQAHVEPGISNDYQLPQDLTTANNLGANASGISYEESTSSSSLKGAKLKYGDLSDGSLPIAHDSASASSLKFYSGVNSPSFLRELNKQLRQKKCYPEPAFVNPYYGRSKKFRDDRMKYGRLWLESYAPDKAKPDIKATNIKWTEKKNTTFCTGWGSSVGRKVFMVEPDYKNKKGEYILKYPFLAPDPKLRQLEAVRVYYKRKK